MSAGDVTYIKDGVAQTSEDHFTAYLSMDRDGGSNSGKPGAPKALVAYPGARVTIGKAHGLDYGIRTPNIPAREDWWVISNISSAASRPLIWAVRDGRLLAMTLNAPAAMARWERNLNG